MIWSADGDYVDSRSEHPLGRGPRPKRVEDDEGWGETDDELADDDEEMWEDDDEFEDEVNWEDD